MSWVNDFKEHMLDYQYIILLIEKTISADILLLDGITVMRILAEGIVAFSFNLSGFVEDSYKHLGRKVEGVLL